jgi:5-methylthioribose kinase
MAQWSMNLVEETWVSFEENFRRLYPTRIDNRVWTDSLLENLLTRWRSETWLFAAAKMSRRIVGLAKAADIEKLEPIHREGAARGVLRLSRTLVQERAVSTDPRRFIDTSLSMLDETKTG